MEIIFILLNIGVIVADIGIIVAILKRWKKRGK